MIIKIKSLSGFYPSYETPGAAGMDIRAFLSEPVLIHSMERLLVPTGIFIEIEDGYEVQIRARSGLAVKHGIGLVNGIGTIDSDYRGEIKIPLINFSQEPYEIRNGDRIAQLIVNAIPDVTIEKVEILKKTERGSGGFGHTGV